MQGLNEFIVEIGKAFKDTITYGSLELYTDYRDKQEQVANKEGVVIATPMQIATEVKVGAKVIIDPTVLFKQVYHGKMQESVFLVDKDKGRYRLEPNMVILYQNPGEEEWKGNNINLFVTPIKEEKKTASGIILSEEKTPQAKGRVAYINEELREEGVDVGDVIYYPADRKWKFEFQGEEYVYLRNIDVLAKEEI